MHQGVEFLTVDRMALPLANMEVEADRPNHYFAGVDIEQRQVLQELFITELVHRLRLRHAGQREQARRGGCDCFPYLFHRFLVL